MKQQYEGLWNFKSSYLKRKIESIFILENNIGILNDLEDKYPEAMESTTVCQDTKKTQEWIYVDNVIKLIKYAKPRKSQYLELKLSDVKAIKCGIDGYTFQVNRKSFEYNYIFLEWDDITLPIVIPTGLLMEWMVQVGIEPNGSLKGGNLNVYEFYLGSRTYQVILPEELGKQIQEENLSIKLDETEFDSQFVYYTKNNKQYCYQGVYYIPVFKETEKNGMIELVFEKLEKKHLFYETSLFVNHTILESIEKLKFYRKEEIAKLDSNEQDTIQRMNENIENNICQIWHTKYSCSNQKYAFLSPMIENSLVQYGKIVYKKDNYVIKRRLEFLTDIILSEDDINVIDVSSTIGFFSSFFDKTFEKYEDINFETLQPGMMLSDVFESSPSGEEYVASRKLYYLGKVFMPEYELKEKGSSIIANYHRNVVEGYLFCSEQLETDKGKRYIIYTDTDKIGFHDMPSSVYLDDKYGDRVNLFYGNRSHYVGHIDKDIKNVENHFDSFLDMVIPNYINLVQDYANYSLSSNTNLEISLPSTTTRCVELLCILSDDEKDIMKFNSTLNGKELINMYRKPE